ncbi:late histone H2B.L4-like [Dipodomys spectabilis]|uniref:late histone H2B.L4-like n=1 Tax=Dipodomys spectabilis TaxID=105255 RepID=UPI001C5356D6|nr:late histone H2B.L4-like [Dipodomys spectabilis]
MSKRRSHMGFSENPGPQKHKKANLTTEKQKPVCRRRYRYSETGCETSYARYFPHLLKKCTHELELSKRVVCLLDSFVNDMFERIASEASQLIQKTNRSSITSRDIQTAVCLLLPEKLGKEAMMQATKALLRYFENE